MILRMTAACYLKFEEYAQAMLVALQLGDDELVSTCLETCPEPIMRKQLAFLLARQQVLITNRVSFFAKRDGKTFEHSLVDIIHRMYLRRGIISVTLNHPSI